MKKGLEKFYELVESLESLPAIGKKSALRLAYHIVNDNSYIGLKISHAIEDAIKNTQKCSKCNCISENEVCEICLDSNRDIGLLALVKSAKDVFTIEESNHFNGSYFVFDDTSDLILNNLISTIKERDIKNILFALTPSLENNAFILYVENKLENLNLNLNFTKIAQGVPTGVSLENVDMLSLSCAIDSRVVI